MSNGLRKHLKQLPYFLLFNYPKKLKTYNTLKEKNKSIESKEKKFKLNAYHSPSPMNELCDYICTWEKKNILWDNNIDNLVDTRVLIVNNDLDLSDKKIIKIIKKYINDYSIEIKRQLKSSYNDVDYSFILNELTHRFKNELFKELKINEELIANYVIKISYTNFAANKSFAWNAYGDYIIKNLKYNSNPKRNVSIREVPYKTNESYEYLGKYYTFKAVDDIGV